MKKSAPKPITMPGNHLQYKDYVGSVIFSEKDATFHGKIIGLKALITFEGDTVAKLTTDFHNAVDEYLTYCEEHEKEPEKPYKGSFNIRIGADLHRRVAMQANLRGMSLNSYVEEAIRKHERENRK